MFDYSSKAVFIVCYRVFKKPHLKEMCIFLNPENVSIGSGVNQNKKLPSFWHIGQKMPFFNGKLSPATENSRF